MTDEVRIEQESSIVLNFPPPSIHTDSACSYFRSMVRNPPVYVSFVTLNLFYLVAFSIFEIPTHAEFCISVCRKLENPWQRVLKFFFFLPPKSRHFV